MKKENSNETQGKTSNNSSLTAKKTENTTRILSPMTGALSVLSYSPKPLHVQNIRRF